MSEHRTAMKILVVFIVIVTVGWGLYSVDYDRCEAEIEQTGSGADIHLHGFNPADYDYMMLSGADVPDHLYYYQDSDFMSYTTQYCQSEFFDTLDYMMDARSMSHGVRAGAQELVSMMMTQTASSTAAGNAVVFSSGALPYILCSDGVAVLQDWILAGGTVYWTGVAIGTSVAYADHIDEDLPGIFPDGVIAEYDEEHVRYGYELSSWTTCLGTTYNNCSSGMNVLTIGASAVSLGIMDEEGYSSMAECQYGSGRIYILGGNVAVNKDAGQVAMLANIICTGVDSDTVILKEDSGQKGYGDTTVSVEADIHPGDVLCLKFGEPYVSWAVCKTF